MNDQHIAVLCDSGTDTPEAFVHAHDVRVVPLRINYSDGTSSQSGVDITADEVIERFKDEIPTTSLPTPEAIRQALEQAKADGALEQLAGQWQEFERLLGEWLEELE